MDVALVSPHQHESLIDLLAELHGHYHDGETIPRAWIREHLQANLLGPGSPHRLVVASTADGGVVGLAAIMRVHSLVDFDPAQRHQCQLKELYVKAAQRGVGVGRALMAWVAGYAIAQGCHRIDWPVKATNARGIALYERLGARQVADRLSYRLTQPALGALAVRG